MGGQFFIITHPWHQHRPRTSTLLGSEVAPRPAPGGLWKDLRSPSPCDVQGQGLGSRPCSAWALVTLTHGRRWPWGKGDEVGETGAGMGASVGCGGDAEP